MFDNTSRMGILFFLWCINQPILCLKDGFCFCVLWTSTTYRVWPCSLSFLLTGCSPDGAFSVLHTRRVPHWEQSEPSHYEKDSVWTAKKIFVAKTAWQTSWTVNTFDNEIWYKTHGAFTSLHSQGEGKATSLLLLASSSTRPLQLLISVGNISRLLYEAFKQRNFVQLHSGLSASKKEK